MNFFCSLDHFLRSDKISKTPAGDGVGFGEGVTGDGVLVHSRKGCHAYMLIWSIDHMLIYLICHNKAVVFHSKLTDGCQLFSCENFSARVGRIADDDGFCSGFESFLHQIDIKFISRRYQRNVDRLCSGKDQLRSSHRTGKIP